MKNIAFKIVSVVCIVCVMFANAAALAAVNTPEILVKTDKTGKSADISIKNVGMTVYSFQITLETDDTDLRLECADDKMYGTTTFGNGKAVLYIDSTKMLNGKNEIKLAKLTSDKKITVGSAADLILVDYSMKPIEYKGIKVTVSQKPSDSGSSGGGGGGGSSGSGGGGNIAGGIAPPAQTTPPVPTTAPDTANVFDDVDDSHWAKASIDYVTSKGLFFGMSDNTFEPSSEMTRAMYVTVLSRFGDRIDAKWHIDCDNPMKFDDIPDDDWYSDAVAWAGGTGLVSGIGDNLFEPHTPITREQMAVMTVNFAKLCGVEMPSNVEETAFADEENIQYWAVDAVHAAQRAGIISGRDDNIFAPQDTATRAEVAAIMHRFAEILG